VPGTCNAWAPALLSSRRVARWCCVTIIAASARSVLFGFGSAGMEKGRVTISADADQCRQAATIELWRIQAGDQVASIVAKRTRSISSLDGDVNLHFALVAESLVTRDCNWSFNELDPGFYVATLRGPQGSLGSQRFAVGLDQSFELKMSSPAVRVSGRLLFNGVPLRDGQIEFIRVPNDDGIDAIAMATSDAAGRYAAVLDRPGKYFVLTTVGKNRPLWTRTVLASGANSLDVVHGGPQLHVRLRNWDRSTPATVIVRGGASSRSVVLQPGGQEELTELDLTYGDYQVLAYQSRGRVSAQPKTASIRADHPSADLDLELVDNQSTLAVRDEKGQPMPFVVVSWLSGRETFARAPQLSPGTYDISGIPPGTEVRIRPAGGDLVPGCRIAQLNDHAEVILKPGRVVNAVFERHGLGGPAGSLSGVEGSDCAIPLSFFQFTRAAVRPGETPRGVFRNFPLSRELIFEYSSISQRVENPDPGTVVFR
jgi:hypothetical protein